MTATQFIGVFSKTYGPYGGSGPTQPVTPAAPVVVYNAITRKLSASHSLGGTIQFSYQNSAFVDYIGPIQVDAAQHNAGDWRFKRLASTGYTESGVANSPAIAPADAPTITSFTPTTGPAGSTMVITGTYFTGATLVSISSGAVASFTVDNATQITAVLTNTQVTGLVRVTTPGGTATSGTPFTVSLPPPSGGNPAALVSADFGSNAYPTTSTKLSALSTLDFLYSGGLNDLSVQVDCQNGGFNGEPIISFYDAAGTFVTKVTPANVSGLQTLPVQLPGSGQRLYRAVGGGAVEAYSTNDFAGSNLRALLPANGATVQLVAPQRANNVVVILTDSINQGDGATNNSRYAGAVVLRDMLRAFGFDVIIIGWGSASAGTMLGNPTLQREKADLVANAFAGRTGECWLFSMVGTNDAYYYPIKAAVAASYISAFFQLVHADTPAAKLVAVSPLWRGNKANVNPEGETLANMTAAILGIGDSYSWVRKADASNWLNAADFVQTAPGAQATDDLHPSDAGHAKIALNLFSIIRASAIPKRFKVGDVAQDSSPLISYPFGSIRNDTPDLATGLVFKKGSIVYFNQAGQCAKFKLEPDVRQIQLRGFSQPSTGTFYLYCNGFLAGEYLVQSATSVNDVFINCSELPIGNKDIEIRAKGDGNVIIDELYFAGTLEFTPSLGSIAIPASVGNDGSDDNTYTFEENNVRVKLIGGWQIVNNPSIYPSGGGAYASPGPGVYAEVDGFLGGTLTFSYFGVTLGGNVDVLIDGVIKATYSQYDADPNGHVKTSSVTGLPAGKVTMQGSASGAGGALFFDSVKGAFTPS